MVHFRFVFRKRSPKSEDDGFLFPDVNASNKCDFETLTKTAQAQKITSSVPVAQQHIFTEPKPKVSNFHCTHKRKKRKKKNKNKTPKKKRTNNDIHAHHIRFKFNIYVMFIRCKNATIFKIHSCRF